MREADNKKRTLEEEVDALREECAKMRAAEQVNTISSKEKAEAKEATKMREALELQMDQLRDAHQKQGTVGFRHTCCSQPTMEEAPPTSQRLISWDNYLVKGI